MSVSRLNTIRTYCSDEGLLLNNIKEVDSLTNTGGEKERNVEVV